MMLNLTFGFIARVCISVGGGKSNLFQPQEEDCLFWLRWARNCQSKWPYCTNKNTSNGFGNLYLCFPQQHELQNLHIVDSIAQGRGFCLDFCFSRKVGKKLKMKKLTYSPKVAKKKLRKLQLCLVPWCKPRQSSGAHFPLIAVASPAHSALNKEYNTNHDDDHHYC